MTKRVQVIVGIGASAGGLQALNEFFDSIPNTTDYTYVVVQHLSPDHKSLMADLLARNTEIPIEVIKDQGEILGNRIYLIPPTKNLVIREGIFHLMEKPKDKSLNLPINLFFESLAEFAKERCAGIILSGTGSDGSRGVYAIKEKGGVIMVQVPEQAKFDGMPQSAINTGQADFIVPVEQMGEELSGYFERKGIDVSDLDEYNFDESTVNKIIKLLSAESRLDFTYYKRPTIMRRIARRMRVLKCDTLPAYLDLLSRDFSERSTLETEFLIGVTRFFRDPEVWEIMKNQIIPEIVGTKEEGEVIKIWDAGCSTGEEPYTLGMLFLEEIQKQERQLGLKIFATDLAQEHLDIASKGEYNEGGVVDIPRDMLNNYFLQKKGRFLVKNKLRQCIIFSNHNIIKDPPFRNTDLVVCRNLLIYLQASIQTKVMETLHYALNVDGYLLLGTSEMLGNISNFFKEINRKWKIFQNLEEASPLRTDIMSLSTNSFRYNKSKGAKRDTAISKRDIPENIKERIGSSILQHFNASSVFIDAQMNIIEAIGAFKKFTRMPDEGFSTNLIELLPKGLAAAVQQGARTSAREGEAVFIQDVSAEVGTLPLTVDVIVDAIALEKKGSPVNYAITLVEKENLEAGKKVIAHGDFDASAKERIKELEDELKEAQYEISNALEEAETSNEELQASNEELLASNEELQSTNEELQSVNEELHTVNTEYIQKLEDLALLNADMDNLLDSTHIGVVFLDKELLIRKFTPAVKEHFNLLKSDIGRPISNFITNFTFRKKSTLISNIEKVMRTRKSVEKRLRGKSGKHFLKRISPFVTSEGKVDGAVITFIDISLIHNSQEQLRKSEEKFKAFYEDDPVLHVSVNLDSGLITECNSLFVQIAGYRDKNSLIGKSIMEFYTQESKLKSLEVLQLLKEKKKVLNREMTMLNKNGAEIDVILNSVPVLDKDGTAIASRSTLLVITELKEAQDELQRQKEVLERANTDLEQFVSICSHDLQEPLSTIRFSSDFIKKKYSDELNDKGKEYLGYIHEASGRMAEQIKGLLEHSRIGKDNEMTKTDLNELVEIVKYDLNKSIQESNATVAVGKLPTLDVYEIEMRLLFQNLLGNALKYRKPNVSPVIKISAYEDEGYWVFSVADNGIGIREEDAAQIFEIFGRVPTEEKYEGTGVGLAHCQKIVRLHDGRIWVNSELGLGSTFYFKLKI
ncbi:MAG: chemotaxis protein CheB [Leeuwenhoekiella sp.]